MLEYIYFLKLLMGKNPLPLLHAINLSEPQNLVQPFATRSHTITAHRHSNITHKTQKIHIQPEYGKFKSRAKSSTFTQ